MNVIRTIVRTKFRLTSRRKAAAQAKAALAEYLELADGLDPAAGQRSTEVPPMLGVDEDMRRWSFFMILEHNTIVNRLISASVERLAKGEEASCPPVDPKKDVMPGESPGVEQVQALADSVEEHLRVVSSLGKLRGTATSPHPLFGNFDAHKWNCMFSFHLNVHLKQAKYVAMKAPAKK